MRETIVCIFFCAFEKFSKENELHSLGFNYRLKLGAIDYSLSTLCAVRRGSKEAKIKYSVAL